VFPHPPPPTPFGSYDNHKVFLFNSTAAPMELRIDVGLATQQHPRRRRLLG
jgi:hypothetical protein